MAPIKHGHCVGNKVSREYKTWESVLDRCLNPGATKYRFYGGRGITVCDRWLDFAAFFADMGPRPDGMTIDRIDNGKGYEPKNCRWATNAEQTANRTDVRNVTAFGETLHLNEWARRTGLKACTIQTRLNRGWEPERALSERLIRQPTMTPEEIEEASRLLQGGMPIRQVAKTLARSVNSIGRRVLNWNVARWRNADAARLRALAGEDVAQ